VESERKKVSTGPRICKSGAGYPATKQTNRQRSKLKMIPTPKVT